MEQEGKAFDVRIEVVSCTGQCDSKHQIGERWYIRNAQTPGGICLGAYSAIHPVVTMLAFGGGYPWRECKEIVRVACQDGANPVIFELTRINPGAD